MSKCIFRSNEQLEPFMKSGIEPPVRKPATSFVNELQLKSEYVRLASGPWASMTEKPT